PPSSVRSIRPRSRGRSHPSLGTKCTPPVVAANPTRGETKARLAGPGHDACDRGGSATTKLVVAEPDAPARAATNAATALRMSHGTAAMIPYAVAALPLRELRRRRPLAPRRRPVEQGAGRRELLPGLEQRLQAREDLRPAAVDLP